MPADLWRTAGTGGTRFPSEPMTQPQDFLEALWMRAHRHAGWLSVLVDRLGLDAQDAEILEELDDRRMELEGLRRRDFPRVQQAVREAVAGVDQAEVAGARERFLEARLAAMEEDIRSRYADYQAAVDNDAPGADRLLILDGIRALEAKRDRLGRELAALRRPDREGRLEDWQIERARGFPLEKLVEPRKGYILCPFHEDQHPSMWVKGGWGYCFVCGAKMDALRFMMDVRGLPFRAAVEALQ